MRFMIPLAALALGLPTAGVAQASPETHALAWHPNGKTPAAIPQTRARKACVEAANHHKGSKGVMTPVVRCTNVEMAQVKVAPETIERGE